MKIHVFGASGSGVTTLGKALSATTGFSYFDSDDYFWYSTNPPFTRRRQPAERNRLISEDICNVNNWILGGSVIDWGEHVFPAFDLVVFLYIPRHIRLQRLEAREWKRYGDAIYNDAVRAQQFANFMKWAADYDNNTGIANRTWQAQKNWLAKLETPVLELNGDMAIEERVQRILKKLDGHTHQMPEIGTRTICPANTIK